MYIHKTYADPIQTPGLNRDPHFARLSHAYLRQLIKECKGFVTILQRSQGKLRDNEGMDRNFSTMQALAHFFVAGAKVIDPNRSIGKNQFRWPRRRGMFFKPGIVAPSAANLRALSRSMSALSASRISAVFSLTPVNSWAA
jgi:hypothetical protein